MKHKVGNNSNNITRRNSQTSALEWFTFVRSVIPRALEIALENEKERERERKHPILFSSRRINRRRCKESTTPSASSGFINIYLSK